MPARRAHPVGCGRVTDSPADAAILLPTELRRLPPLQAVWMASFHSVSAFCNAGFSLRSDNLVGDRANPAVILPIAGLIILGGLGFGVLTEVSRNLWTRARGQRPKRLSLHARTALAATGVLLLAGTVGFLILERGNLLRETDPMSRFLTSFFASVTPRTAGFNSFNYAHVTTATVFLTIVLMGIGGCPGSTAGGIKATTLAVLFATARARLQGRRWTSLFGRGIPDMAVDKAVGVVTLVTVLVVGGTLLLSAVELAWPERYGVALLAAWQAGQEGPPAPPAPDRTIAETDVLILAGHIDQLRELKRVK